MRTLSYEISQVTQPRCWQARPYRVAHPLLSRFCSARRSNMARTQHLITATSKEVDPYLFVSSTSTVSRAPVHSRQVRVAASPRRATPLLQQGAALAAALALLGSTGSATAAVQAFQSQEVAQVAGFLGLPSPGEAQEAVKNAPPRNPNQQSDQSNPQGRTPPEVAGQGPEQAANAVQRENAAESPLNESAGPQSSQSTS